MSNKKVKMYSLSTCIHCKNTKKFFSSNNVDFEFVDVDLLEGAERESALKAVDKLVSERGFPTIIIGDVIIQGFKEINIREALGLE